MFSHTQIDQDSACQYYVCPVPDCKKKLKSKFSLQRHNTLLHKKGLRKHQCDICKKTFALRQYLREHMVVHTNESPFRCDIDGCSMRFRQRGTLCSHRKTHKNYVPKTPSRTRGFKSDRGPVSASQ